jgi:Cysteine-rich CPXCG
MDARSLTNVRIDAASAAGVCSSGREAETLWLTCDEPSRRMGEVKRHKARELNARAWRERLTRQIADLDPSSIDSLYGLEPVYEPGKGLPGLLPEEFVAVQCPYCGERLETRVDLTADEPSYIEDCQVCCRPIEFTVERDQTGALLAVRVQRVD